VVLTLALGCTVLTGAAGLVYEIVWQRYLMILLGSQAESVATVLGVFLGCLALGYAVFGHVARGITSSPQGARARLLSAYALAEAGIGAYAWLFPALFSIVHSLTLAAPAGVEGFSFDVLASALLIAPPTILMGATIPLLTQALPSERAESTRIHAWVYGLNAVGACVGALAAGFLVIPRLGLDGSMGAAGAVNLASALCFTWLARRERSDRLPVDLGEAGQHPGAGRLAPAALLLGFAMMAVQISLNRIGALSLGSSEFTFCMVVAIFLLCIAAGSLAVSSLPRVPRALSPVAPWLLAAGLLALHPLLQDGPYWAHRLRTHFGTEPGDFQAYQLASGLALLAVFFVPIGLSGAILPLLFHESRRAGGAVGGLAGRLYAWNTLGSLLGALLAGNLLLHWIDLDQVHRLAVSAVVVAAWLVAGWREGALRPALSLAAAAVLLAVTWSVPDWDPARLASGLFRQREAIAGTAEGPVRFFSLPGNRQTIVFHGDDPTTTVSVSESDLGNGRRDRALLVNGKSDGLLIGEYAVRALNALLPSLFAGECKRAFVVGLGTGVSASVLARLEPHPIVDVAEISSGVIRAAPLFDYGNDAASKSERIRVARTDAFRALSRGDELYDVILSEPSNPWVTGIETLFSREFYELARRRLAPGGVFGQWMHTYELDTATLALVLRTFSKVFEHVAVWYTGDSDLLLLAAWRPDALLDLRRLARRVARPDFAAELERAGVRGLPGLLAHELIPVEVLGRDWAGEIHTLRRPVLGQRAARAFFRNSAAALPLALAGSDVEAGRRTSLLGRGLARPRGDRAFWERLLGEACTHRPEQCATLIAWARSHGVATEAELGAFVDRARARPQVDELLAPRRLDRLEALFAPAALPPSLTVDEAREYTELYVNAYVHGAPFEKGALDQVWRRCADDAAACRAGRMRTEEVLGPLVASADDAAAR
jgi:spermidine synthase